jgi:hypothetical protein
VQDGLAYEESHFKGMMKLLNLLSDDNAVSGIIKGYMNKRFQAGDFCVSAMRFCQKYEHIEEVLQFAEGKKITGGTDIAFHNANFNDFQTTRRSSTSRNSATS